MTEQGDVPAMAEAVQESNSVPYAYKYVEYKCGFKNRAGEKVCQWSTGLIGKKIAREMIGDHWNKEHENDHKQISHELELEREEALNQKILDLKAKEHTEAMRREAELFKIKLENAAKLKQLETRGIKQEDLGAAGIDLTLDENEGNEENGDQKVEAGTSRKQVPDPSYAEIALAMREQTKMFQVITNRLDNQSKNSATDAAIKSIESMAQSQLKTKAILTKEPKCPKLIKNQKLEQYWKEYDKLVVN